MEVSGRVPHRQVLTLFRQYVNLVKAAWRSNAWNRYRNYIVDLRRDIGSLGWAASHMFYEDTGGRVRIRWILKRGAPFGDWIMTPSFIRAVARYRRNRR